MIVLSSKCVYVFWEILCAAVCICEHFFLPPNTVDVCVVDHVLEVYTFSFNSAPHGWTQSDT